jgi:pullulanase/glycogen debranching enzyme
VNSQTSQTKIGRSSPLGATIVERGGNFGLFSRSAKGVELLLTTKATLDHRALFHLILFIRYWVERTNPDAKSEAR